VKILEWKNTKLKPNCEIIESIGEAGNLDAESMRLLRTYDICTESYENDEKQSSQTVHECLRKFTENIDPKTKEWIIP
jgi:exoribonuclease R